MAARRIPRVLSIAGSDSGGGAGIQADLKAFAACRVHGMTAVTAVTAQNTIGVDAVHHVPGEVIVAQVAAVAADIGIDAVKIGMLGTAETILAVSRSLDLLGEEVPIVIDPVMVSESGGVLLESAARGVMVQELLPRAWVATPNLPEARALAGDEQRALRPAELAGRIHAMGPRAVVLTGGHADTVTDVFFDGEQIVEIGGERHPDGAAHGSGCTHSSVLAARLAWGDTPLEAARAARRMAGAAVRDGLREIGHGAGPVDVIGVSVRSAPAPPEAVVPGNGV